MDQIRNGGFIVSNQEVIVNEQLQEQIHYETPDFPLARFIDQLDCFVDGAFLCHWHPEFELAVVLQGSVEYQLNKQPFRLCEGEGIFIGSQTLHYARQLAANTVVFNIVFSPTFFSTILTSSLYHKYFSAVSLRKIKGYSITENTEEGSQILACLQHIHSYDPRESAYELACMEELLRIWRNLLSLIKHDETASPATDNFLREHRMREMIAFVQANFVSHITVEDIAAAANVSRSECFRCFALFCNAAPMEFVNQYRFQHVAQKMAYTDDSISDICFSCGFSSISYFGKAFRKTYGMSPSDFRKIGNSSKIS
jgi:AraC-like DNA-binding protein